MTDLFLFARLNLPNVLISVAKKTFHSDFLSPCFDVPKASNFTSSGVQNRDTQNRRLGTIMTSIQDSKPREKQISQSFSYCELINLLRNGTIVRCLWENNKTSEAWSPELTSFPVPCFWSRGTPPEVKFDASGTSKHGKGKSLWKKFFCCTYQYIGEIWWSK